MLGLCPTYGLSTSCSSSGSCSDPREALRALSVKELRLEAGKLGVAPDAIEKFRDQEVTKEHFISLVLSKMPLDAQRERLRTMSKRELRLEAQKFGVAAEAIDQSRDNDISNEEFAQLIANAEADHHVRVCACISVCMHMCLRPRAHTWGMKDRNTPGTASGSTGARCSTCGTIWR